MNYFESRLKETCDYFLSFYTEDSDISNDYYKWIIYLLMDKNFNEIDKEFDKIIEGL